MNGGGKGGRDVCVGGRGEKIGKESRLSPVIRGGESLSGGGWVRRVREDRGSLIKSERGREGEGGEKGRLCLASRESRQLSVLIRAAQYCED